MRRTFAGWFGFILISLSIVLAVILMISGTPWTEAIHSEAANAAMGVAFIAWGAAEDAQALAKRGKDRLP